MGISVRGTVITTGLEMFVEECYSCAIPFAFSTDYKKERQRDKRDFYCPNGHSQHYLGEREEDRLRRELSAAQDATARAEARERAQRERREAEERRHAATKGILTKTRMRIANGVCPCCHRSFVNVQRHIETKHPDYANTVE